MAILELILFSLEANYTKFIQSHLQIWTRKPTWGFTGFSWFRGLTILDKAWTSPHRAYQCVTLHHMLPHPGLCSFLGLHIQLAFYFSWSSHTKLREPQNLQFAFVCTINNDVQAQWKTYWCPDRLWEKGKQFFLSCIFNLLITHIVSFYFALHSLFAIH